MKSFNNISRFYINFSILFLLCGCNKDKNSSLTNDLKVANLYGKVSSMRVIFYEAEEKFGEPTIKEGARRLTTLHKFNSEGFYEKIISWDGDHTDYMYSYDKNKKITKIVKSEINSSDSIVLESLYKNGLLLEEKSVNMNHDLSFMYTYHKEYNYNEANELMEVNSFATDGRLKTKTKYIYSDNNIEVSNFNSDGKLFSKENKKIDSKRNVLESIYIQYDRLGTNEIETINSPIVSMQTTTKYNASGKIIEQEDNFGHTVIYKKFKYDSFGNLTEEFRERKGTGDSKITIEKSIYEYDKNRNWIKKISFENDHVKEIWERVIEYY